ncbi:MAG: hypothetical protein IT443_13485 [Phycisphaeraceae bacterium]|nr:hypothetical protein [Phycisphaeraceae bacterium]
MGQVTAGKVTWNGPACVSRSWADDKITLGEEVFNQGSFGLGPGKCGAIVEASIEQISVVPLPAAVWGGVIFLSMLGAGKIVRRRN